MLTRASELIDRVPDADEWRRAALFLLFGVILAFVLQEGLLAGLRRYRDGNVGVMNSVIQGEIKADVVISGSRARVPLRTPVSSKTSPTSGFTISGGTGRVCTSNSICCGSILKGTSRPSILIQNLDVASRSPTKMFGSGKYIAWLSDQEVYEHLFQQKRYYALYRWFPLLGLACTGGTENAVLGLIMPERHSDYKGYSPQYLTWNTSFALIQAQHPTGLKLKIDPLKVKSLAAVVELCQRNGVRPILVYSPDYRETQWFFPTRRQTVQAFQEIARRYGISFWDYSQDPISGEKGYFYNSQHLNNKGAAAFSRALAGRLASEVFAMRPVELRPAVGPDQTRP